MSYVKWFRDIKKQDFNLVGGKGANLGELFNSRFPVPQGFCLTIGAYKKFLEDNKIKEEINRILENVDYRNHDSLINASNKIKDLFVKGKFPEEIKKEILEAYEDLNVDEDILKTASKDALDIIKTGREPAFVAVRSSATSEDKEGASFAGQQETFLNIKGGKQVIENVVKCWVSFFNPRAIFYRLNKGFSNYDNFMGVVVQRMVNSSKSGVMFTLNPINNNKDEIIIEAAYGLGETVGLGYVNPDLYIVDKNDFSIKDKKIFNQKWKLVKDPNSGGTIKKEVEDEFAENQKLADDVIKDVAELGKKIEYYYGKAQDVEFGVEDNRVFILQSRPVTSYVVRDEVNVNGEVILNGMGVSPGVISGKVKLVKNLEDYSKVEEGDILVSDFANPDLVTLMGKVKGILLKEGGLTSDIGIISREMKIPCIVGVESTEGLNDNDLITVDANNGNVYKGNLVKEEQIPKEVVSQVERVDTITKVKADVNLREDAEKAVMNGADGVGVLRGEFIVSNLNVHPGVLIYQDKEKLVNSLIDGIISVASYFKGKPVLYKTFDIRSDVYQNLIDGIVSENNPMCGLRGIRRDLDQEELLWAQFEAVRAVHEKGYNNVGILLPLVTEVEQIKRAKEILRNVGLEPQDEIDFGIMIDTPASVQIIEEICKEGIDFICFGTNDLSQFTFGMDQYNEKVRGLFSEMNPAVLRQINQVIKVCKKYNVETNISGDAASNPEMAEFVVKAGIDAISPKPEHVNHIRNVISRIEKKILLDVARKDFEV